MSRRFPRSAGWPQAADDPTPGQGADGTGEDQAPGGAPSEDGALKDEPHASEASVDVGARLTNPGVVSVELGLDASNAPVTWNVSTKGSPHAFILGIPGQGKSVTTRRIIREFGRQSLPSLVLDFHGDMVVDPPAGAQIIDAAQGLQFSPFELSSMDDMTVNTTAYEVAEIVSYVCGLGEIQRNHVYKGLQQAYKSAGGTPSMTQFADAVEESESAGRRQERAGAHPAADRLRAVRRRPAERFVDSWDVTASVIDLSDLTLETVQLGAGGLHSAKGLPRDVPLGRWTTSCGWPSSWTKRTGWPRMSHCRS